MFKLFKKLFKPKTRKSQINYKNKTEYITEFNSSHQTTIDRSLSFFNYNGIKFDQSNDILLEKKLNDNLVKTNIDKQAGCPKPNLILDKKENEQENNILTTFQENLSMFHNFVLPLYIFSKKFNLDNKCFSDAIKKGYLKNEDNKSWGLLSRFITNKIQESKDKILYEATIRYNPRIADNIISELFSEQNSEFFKSVISPFDNAESYITKYRWYLETCYLGSDESKNKSIAESFLKEQLKISFVKVFTYSNFLKGIDNNTELGKILLNALHKYHYDIEEISSETYEIFLEYMKLNTTDFPLFFYYELISMYVINKKNEREHYNENELSLNFDYKSMKLNDIVDKIIETRTYQNFDINKLVLSIIYHKISTFEKVIVLLKELENINNYIKKIKTARTKFDLLNNDYSTQSITISDIDLMGGKEFEEFLCGLFTKLNYTCKNTKTSGDQGVDIIAAKDNNKIAIQAKCYSRPVGNHAVMEIIAGAKYYNANQSMVITNSTFTKAATELAKANGVILWDRKKLIEKLKDI